jgi:hypothetical protein
MSLTSYRAAPPRDRTAIFARAARTLALDRASALLPGTKITAQVTP